MLSIMQEELIDEIMEQTSDNMWTLSEYYVYLTMGCELEMQDYN